MWNSLNSSAQAELIKETSSLSKHLIRIRILTTTIKLVDLQHKTSISNAQASASFM